MLVFDLEEASAQIIRFTDVLEATEWLLILKTAFLKAN